MVNKDKLLVGGKNMDNIIPNRKPLLSTLFIELPLGSAEYPGEWAYWSSRRDLGVGWT